MNRIRACNVRFFSALPYRVLESVDFIQYQEATPTESAQLLNEGEVDLALIPVSEFASFGGYVGLDFGLASIDRIESVQLFADEPVHRLKTIYLDDSASSASALLRLLLSQRWMINPTLMRVKQGELLGCVGGTSAALVIGDLAINNRHRYRASIDLSSAWYDWTRLPFVYSVWAARRDVISREQCLKLNELFHKATRAREALARYYPDELTIPPQQSAGHVSEVMKYYLDSDCIAGLEEFFKRASRVQIVPRSRYISATFNINPEAGGQSRYAEPLDSLLQYVSEGRRISVIEGVRLAQQASLADLSLVADMIRVRATPQRSIYEVARISEHDFEDLDLVVDKVKAVVRSDNKRVVLLLDTPKLDSLERYESAIAEIVSKCEVIIEGFSIEQLLMLSRNSRITLESVIERLVRAGLKGVPGLGGGMLIDRIMRRKAELLASSISSSHEPSVSGHFSSREWLQAYQWLHRLGCETSCCLSVGPDESWEERLVHLDRLRALQDETPGFRYFFTEMSPEWDRQGGQVPPELKARATIVSRLFLDNVPFIQELSLTNDAVLGVMSLCFGANEVRVQANGIDDSDALRTMQLLRTLWGIGMDFDSRALNSELGTNKDRSTVSVTHSF